MTDEEKFRILGIENEPEREKILAAIKPSALRRDRGSRVSKATWGAVFNRYKARGCDPSDAAFRADQWEQRKRPLPPPPETK